MPSKSEEQVRATKVVLGMLNLTPLTCSAPLRGFVCWLVLMSGSLGWAQEAATADESAGDEPEDVTILAPFQVKGVRMEDFGLRVRPSVLSKYPKTAVGFLFARCAPMIYAVVPNTAAAKAGLQPGERILKSDGRSMIVGTFAAVQLGKWRKAQKKKWAEDEAGKRASRGPLKSKTRRRRPSAPSHWWCRRHRRIGGPDLEHARRTKSRHRPGTRTAGGAQPRRPRQRHLDLARRALRARARSRF